LNAPDSFYVKSMRVANTAIEAQGISGRHAGANVPLEIVISRKGAALSGRVYAGNGEIAPGAAVTVVPDPAAGRPHLYKTGFADQAGLFQVTGLAPGRYTAFAYYDEAPCELYDPNSFARCRSQGTDFTVDEGAQAMLAIRLNDAPGAR
jgi:hypothetical protein